jgi:Holliday junction resolvase RusA-like endonuclease
VIERGSSAIELHIPTLPPSSNRIWRRSGRTIHKSPAYVRWLRDAGWAVKAQRPGTIRGPYRLMVAAARSSRVDLDNTIKPISDLLQGIGVIEDDKLAESVSARWDSQVEGVTVRVETVAIIV